MNDQRPVFWHQGLFLQPQHFQLTDVHSRTLLIPFYKFAQPHFWGVGEVEISEASLATRAISLTSGEFLFQDGTHVTLPGNAVLEDRSFDEAWIEGDRPFTVYLGLKKWNNTGENVTVLPKLEGLAEVTTRFVTTPAPEEVRDLHEGGPSAEIKRLNHVLKICWETEKESLSDYLLLPLIRLQRHGDEIRPSENFIPPALTIRSCPALYNILKEVRDQIAGRSRRLEEHKAQRGIQTAEFGTRDMVYLLALRSLNRYVPLLFHLTEAAPHPWAAYGLLRQLIGELSSFSTEVNVLGQGEDGTSFIGKYDHEDLGACFPAAQALITRLLDEITAGPEYVIPLLFDGTYFTAALPPTMFEGHNRYFLVVETEAEEASVISALQGIAKLGSRVSLPILIARALPGTGLEHQKVPPQELPRRTRSVYFRIDHHSKQWAQIEKDRNMALYWDAAPEDFKVELMVVGRG